MKKVFKAILIILAVIIVAAALFIGYLTVTEFKPAPVEQAKVSGEGETLKPDESIKVLSWNIGYAGLGEGSDFFMDGGKDTASADKATVNKYLDGIAEVIESSDADIRILQEVDTASSRTYGIDERAKLQNDCGTYALNYSCPFVPFPMPPIGKVNSGLFTDSEFEITSAERISLPCPFSWPVRAANLKRCLLVSYIPIEGSDRQLVLVNLHLEAYDSGEGKIAQTKQLRDFIAQEYEKGNYVIAGGDFNQVFPGALDIYPNTHEELWKPGVLEESILPEGFSFAYDLSVPSCRLLNQPYEPSDAENTQHYVIDGFIISPNIELVSVGGIDAGFKSSDHNPVLLEVKLK